MCIESVIVGSEDDDKDGETEGSERRVLLQPSWHSGNIRVCSGNGKSYIQNPFMRLGFTQLQRASVAKTVNSVAYT